jgi:hypothetical protein
LGKKNRRIPLQGIYPIQNPKERKNEKSKKLKKKKRKEKKRYLERSILKYR